MRSTGIPLLVAISLALSTSVPFARAQGETNAPAPDFKQVYDLIREHLAGVSEPDLNRAAVQGLVSGLAPRVALMEDKPPETSEDALVSKTGLYDGQIGYLRISRVAEGLAQAVRQSYAHLAASNELHGLVIDLRYASGQDYAAASDTVDLFLAKERPLLDWGKGMVKSKEKDDALSLPVAVLVNRETAGSAEALAAVLRQSGAGLLFGSKTAGQAMVAQEYPLGGGVRLRIASGPIRLGDNVEISSDGVKPDINVSVAPQAEKSYFADAFKDPVRTNLVAATSLSGTNAAATNRVRRPRFNEAELVRERRDGFLPDADAAESPDVDPDRNVVRDPVLARALDVLKGLAVVRRARS